MKAEQDDQIAERPGRRGLPVMNFVVAALLIVAVGFVLWYTGDEEEAPAMPEVAAEPAPIVPAKPAPAPDIPRAVQAPPPAPVSAAPADPVAPAPPPPPPEPELPSEEESDAWLMAQLSELGVRQSLLNLFDSAHPLSVSAAVLDGLSRGTLMRKMIPGWSPTGAFPADKIGEELYLDPEGYKRYDTVVNTLTDLEPATIEQGFHRLRPLYERTYGELGLDPDDFDNALIRVLDQVIAAPVLEEPPRLLQESVMYTFADPALEALSPLEKQLLRMGPDNTRKLQQHAQTVRAELLSAN